MFRPDQTGNQALSNQKFSDFCRQFGPERVGLLTGDTNINRGAQVRRAGRVPWCERQRERVSGSMCVPCVCGGWPPRLPRSLLRLHATNAFPPPSFTLLTQVTIMTTEVYRNMLYTGEEADLQEVFAVVFDEFHYMNDPDRGRCVLSMLLLLFVVAVVVVAVDAHARTSAGRGATDTDTSLHYPRHGVGGVGDPLPAAHPLRRALRHHRQRPPGT